MDVDVETGGSYALLTDGRCVQIRHALRDDWQAVHDFAGTLGRPSIYHRFFGVPAFPGKLLADSACAPVRAETATPRAALLALLGGTVVGLAEWTRGPDPLEAEIAFAVSDRLQGHGVATLLAEHLLDDASRAGVRRFTAITQAENRAMLDVFATLGIPVRKEWDHGTCVLSVDLDLHAAERVALLDAAARRERIADDVSLHHLLAPASIAVLGDPRDAATSVVLRNLADFTGRLLTAGADGSGLPDGVDVELAVVTSPPKEAVEAVRACALHGVSAVIVTSTGFDDASGRDLLEVCRGAGIRLLGPGSLGIINTAVDGGVNASLAEGRFGAGRVGVAVQSGGVGLALLRRLRDLDVGVGAFAAVGDKYDVTANDLLMHWEGDPDIRLGLLHVESFGNPRKFARTARALSRRMPLLAVDPEQSPSQARTALYAQAGITAVPSIGALVCAAALLTHQPAPRGRRVAVLANTRGMLSLAVQACTRAGLDVTAARNLTPAADERHLADAVAGTVLSGDCDAVLVALAPTSPAAIFKGLARYASGEGIPLTVVLTEQRETVTVLYDDDEGAVLGFNDPADAAAALAAAAATLAVRARREDPAPEPDRVDHAAARQVVDACLKATPRGRALYASERTALLEAFGISPARGAGSGPRDVRKLTVTAWQDPVFGPLLTCGREDDSAPRTTLLAPAGADDLAALARGAADRPVPGAADRDRGGLAGLLARVAAMADQVPQLASLRLDVDLAEDGTARVTGSRAHIAPSNRVDPYLRRLRRAPVD